MRAGNSQTITPAPQVSIDERRRQIQVRVRHGAWDPRRAQGSLGRRRRALGHGGRPVPRARDRRDRHPAGRRRRLSGAAAFFNAAFRFDEPWQHTFPPDSVFTDPAWWRDRQQGHALAANNLAPFHANVDFAKLEAGVTDDMRGEPEGVPTTGPMNRILASHFETSRAPTTRPPAAAPTTARASSAGASSRTRSTSPGGPSRPTATA